jgi:hypothetical protein
MVQDMRNYIVPIAIISTVAYQCICESIPLEFHLGEYEAELLVKDSVLSVGDSLFFKMSIPALIAQTDGKELNIDRGVELFIKVTTERNPADTATTSNSDIFATGETIFSRFGEFFELIVVNGLQLDYNGEPNPYSYLAERVEANWVVEIIYITKQAASYTAKIQIREILASQLDLEKGQCWNGPDNLHAKAVWKQSEFNRVSYLFQSDASNYPDYFGFIVTD